jgi:hypothetical protein
MMLNRTFRIACLVLVIVLFTPVMVWAHSYHVIAGEFGAALIWRHEPVIAGVVNAALINITQVASSKGVNGLENTLKVQVTQPDGQVLELPLQRSHETGVFVDGSYLTPDFTPPVEGNYRFTLIGIIDELAVNEDIATELCVNIPPGGIQPIQTTNPLVNTAVIGLGIVLAVVAVLGPGYVMRSRMRKEPDGSQAETDDMLS